MEIIQLERRVHGMKIVVSGINSRVELTEDRISELEDRATGFTQFEQQRKIDWKEKKEEQCLFWL